MYKLQKKGRNQMNREEYNRVLEKLAEKRGITEAEAEQGLQGVLDDIFEYLDDTARSRWLKLAGKKDKMTTEDFVECMAELFQIVEKKR
jgi:hypothetical protein